MDGLPGIEVVEVLRRARATAARPPGHQDRAIGQDGRVVLPPREGHLGGLVLRVAPRRGLLAQVEQFGVGDGRAAAADVEHLVGAVQDGRTVVPLPVGALNAQIGPGPGAGGVQGPGLRQRAGHEDLAVRADVQAGIEVQRALRVARQAAQGPGPPHLRNGVGDRASARAGEAARQHQHAAVGQPRHGRVPPAGVHRRPRRPRAGHRVVDGCLVHARAVGQVTARDEQAPVGQERVPGAEQVGE